jgi:hypothetical protein
MGFLIGDKIRRIDDKTRCGKVLDFEECPDFYSGVSIITPEGGHELWRLEDCEHD